MHSSGFAADVDTLASGTDQDSLACVDQMLDLDLKAEEQVDTQMQTEGMVSSLALVHQLMMMSTEAAQMQIELQMVVAAGPMTDDDLIHGSHQTLVGTGQA